MKWSMANLVHRSRHAHRVHSRAIELMHMADAGASDFQDVPRREGRHSVIGNVALAGLPVGGRVSVTRLGAVSGIAHCPLNDQHDPFTDGDVAGRSRAMVTTFDAVCAQLRAKAEQMGGDGVVEITFTQEEYEYEWNEISIQEIALSASGMAIKVSGITIPRRPFLTNGTSHDVSLLASDGVVPADLVFGFTTYYVAMTAKDKAAITGLKQSMRNVEMAHLVDGSYRARQMAMRHMMERAASVDAHGIVAIHTFMDVEAQTTHKVLNYLPETATDYRVTFFALGTAVIQVDRGARPPLQPTLVLHVSDNGHDRAEW